MNITREKLNNIFKENTTTFRNGHSLVDGLSIIKKYTNHSDPTSCGDGFLYSEDVDKIISNGLTEQEAVKLAKIGWDISEQSDCFIY